MKDFFDVDNKHMSDPNGFQGKTTIGQHIEGNINLDELEATENTPRSLLIKWSEIKTEAEGPIMQIPEEMKSQYKWVPTLQNSDVTLYCPFGFIDEEGIGRPSYASLNSFSLYTTLDDAWCECNDSPYGEKAHPGFVVTDDDPYVVIALRNAIDPATHKLRPCSQVIVSEAGSYAEIALNGTDVHIIGVGTIGQPSIKCGRVELYSSGYCALMTGNHLPDTPLMIEAFRFDELQEVDSPFQKLQKLRRNAQDFRLGI